MTEEIKRAVGSIIVEVINSNPNGDPDRDGAPRQREDGRGEISDKSVKRKWRDFLENHDCDKFRAFQNIYSFDPERFHIFESRRRNWKQLISEISSSAEDYRETDFCRKYWDGRVFGNTILENAWKYVQPSMRADCSKSYGISRKYDLIIHIPKPSMIVRCMITIEICVSIRCILRKKMKKGIVNVICGTIRVERTPKSMYFDPFGLYALLESIYAAGTASAMSITQADTAIISELAV